MGSSMRVLPEKTQSGGELTQSGGELTQSGGESTQSGGELTQSGGELNQSGGGLLELQSGASHGLQLLYPSSWGLGFRVGIRV
jgi:hypothetical protein